MRLGRPTIEPGRGLPVPALEEVGEIPPLRLLEIGLEEGHPSGEALDSGIATLQLLLCPFQCSPGVAILYFQFPQAQEQAGILFSHPFV